MTRKHPHLPQFHKGPSAHRDGMEPKRRRKHGIFSKIEPSPAAIRRAEQRKALYMHSAARASRTEG